MAARGGYDNSALSERGIRGLFYDALETTFDQTWASQVGLYMPSDTETEKHRWLGQVPGFREWIGGLQINGLNNQGIDITNKKFEDSISASLDDLRRDKIGHMKRKMADLAGRANNHWEELLVALKAANPLAYDGVAFYATTHVIGDSGTMSNLLSAADVPALNVTTPARPTKAEAAAILTGLASYFFRYKDDRGKKANQGAKQFLAVVPPDMAPGFLQAIHDERYITGGSNELKNLGWQFTVVPEPELSATDVMYLHRVDGPSSRPFILQEEVAPHVQYIGEDSEHAKKTDSVVVIAKTIRNVGPGEFRHSLKATLS